MQFYRVGDYYHYHSLQISEHLHPSRISIKDMEDGRVRFSLDLVGRSKHLDIQEHFAIGEVVDRFGNVYGSTVADILDGANIGTDVNVSDQTTPAIIAPFNKTVTSTVLSSSVSINDYQITLDSVAGAGIGLSNNDYIVLFNPIAVRFSQFRITAINGNTLTLDGLMDFAYPAGTYVDIGTTNMGGQTGSTASPNIFGLRGTGAPPGVDLTLDVTRLLLTSRTTTAVDLSKFADITQLANGLLFRRRDGVFRNIMSIKSNAGFQAVAYDWQAHSAQNLQQGQHGMAWRFTLAGQTKVGVAVRLPIGDDLECIILDSLASVAELVIVAEGHITDPF